MAQWLHVSVRFARSAAELDWLNALPLMTHPDFSSGLTQKDSGWFRHRVGTSNVKRPKNRPARTDTPKNWWFCKNLVPAIEVWSTVTNDITRWGANSTETSPIPFASLQCRRQGASKATEVWLCGSEFTHTRRRIHHPLKTLFSYLALSFHGPKKCKLWKRDFSLTRNIQAIFQSAQRRKVRATNPEKAGVNTAFDRVFVEDRSVVRLKAFLEEQNRGQLYAYYIRLSKRL